MIRYFISLCLLACAILPAEAQSIRVNAQFDSTAILVGDQIKLRIELERQKNIHVEFPIWTDTLTRNIEIVHVYPVDSSQSVNDMVKLTQDIEVTSFESGRHVVPPIRFTFTENGITDTIKTVPIYLDVSTMPMDTAQVIYDIKPIYQVPVGWDDVWPWLVVLAILLVISAVIGFIIYAIIRLKNNKPIFGSPKPVEPPHIVAIRELDKLRNDKLWQNNQIKEYYTRLSDIIRVYIEGRFEVAAMEMTSDEILAGLHRAGFEDNNLMSRLRKLFITADLVKFAKAAPEPTENETLLLDTYLFVNNTKIEQVEPGETRDAEENPSADNTGQEPLAGDDE